MIYYAYSHKEGAKQVALKYGLRNVPSKEYISEGKLEKFVSFPDRNALFYAMQTHPDVFAYTLKNLKLYFHPDTILPIIGEAHRIFFNDSVWKMDYA